MADELACEHMLDAAHVAAEALDVPVEMIRLHLHFGDRGPVWNASAGDTIATDFRPLAALRKLAARAKPAAA